MRSRGPMLNSKHRDCWDCDNRIGRRRTRCTCDAPTRLREKRSWQKDVDDELGCELNTARCFGGDGCAEAAS